MRYYLDEDQSQKTAQTADQHFGLYIASSHQVGLDHAPDDEQLLFAGREGLCIVTRDGSDFIALTDLFESQQLPHAGVLIIPRSIPNNAYFRIARALAHYHELYPDGVPPYFISYLHEPPDEQS
jgi:predicted nuclease of predicted toxin-antitoxin system